jgi:dTDP-4-amino-4,6-dideoxygalactose transaminase/intein/homing endonuclease
MSQIPLHKVLVAPDAHIKVNQTLYSGVWTEGPRVKELEAKLRQFLGCDVLATNSCTSAIDLALHLCGVGPGDQVISTPLTCSATNTHALLRGAQLVWADVNPETGLIDPESVAKRVTARTKAIVVVDWGGRPVDCSKIRGLLPRDIPIIQDAAHSFGATIPEGLTEQPAHAGEKSGTYVAWSFQAIKALTSVTPDTEVFIRRNGVADLVEIGTLDRAVIGEECASFTPDGTVKWSKITDFIVHDIDDEILTVSLQKGRTVKVTRSHSLYTFNGTAFVERTAGDLKEGDLLAVPRRLPLAGKAQERLDILELLPTDCLMVRGGKVRMTSEGRSGQAGKWISRFIDVTPSFCKALGYYVAEGNIANYNRNGKGASPIATFSFHAKERNTHIKELAGLLRATWPEYAGLKVYEKKGTNGVVAMFGSTLVSKILLRLCGSGAHTKKIPTLIWAVSDECKWAFIDGLLNGDGHKRSQDGYTPYETLGVCSKSLANGLHYLLLSMGVQSSVSEYVNPRPLKDGGQCKKYSCILINRGGQEQSRENTIPSEFVVPRWGKKSTSIASIVRDNKSCPPSLLRDVALLRVEGIHREPYRGPVYDFSVDGVENFIGGYGAICLHNTGDGGALKVPSHEFARARALRWFGIDRDIPAKFRFLQNIPEAGYKYHMNDLAASLGLANFDLAVQSLQKHRSNAMWLFRALAKCRGVQIPLPDRGSSWWFYSLLSRKRFEFIDFLESRGIGAGPVHGRNDVCTAYDRSHYPLPGVDSYESQHVAIPCGWWLSKEDLERIADTVLEWDKQLCEQPS